MRTEQLYDANEETWLTKLHIGCGGVYLRGYKNIDIFGELSETFLEEEMLAHSTTIGEYYRTDGTWDDLPERKAIIVDGLMRMQAVEYKYPHGSVDKIVAIQSMEHIDPIDFTLTLGGFLQVLRKPGVLIVSVPDMDGALDWLEDPEKAAFAIRHLRGVLRDRRSKHHSWWTHETLAKAFEWVGFDSVRLLQNFHAYPAIVMKGERIGR